MKINTRVISEGYSTETLVARAQEISSDRLKFCGELRCECSFDRNGNEILVSIQYAGNVEMECARCLNVYAHPCSGKVHVVLIHSTVAHKLGDDDVVFSFDDQHAEVDLTNVIIDDIIVELPMKPLCAENCKGIEYHRGSGKKEKDHIDTPGSPWAVLAKLKDKNH